MDEKYMEMAGNLAQAEQDQGRAACAKVAMPSTDLEPEQYKRVDCAECEEPLPTFRMKKGFELCVSCQSAKERAQKR